MLPAIYLNGLLSLDIFTHVGEHSSFPETQSSPGSSLGGIEGLATLQATLNCWTLEFCLTGDEAY